jgi:hypothetical protein
LFTGGIAPERFQRDLEAIQLLGETTHSREMEQVVSDFGAANHLERGFLRRVFRFRVSGERMTSLYKELSASIRPPAATTESTAIRAPEPLIAPRPIEPLRPVSAEPTPNLKQVAGNLAHSHAQIEGRHEVNAVLFKKIRRIHELVNTGRSIDIAARECGLNVEQVRRAVQELAPDRPEFAWLMGYLEQSEELAEVRGSSHRD